MNYPIDILALLVATTALSLSWATKNRTDKLVCAERINQLLLELTYLEGEFQASFAEARHIEARLTMADQVGEDPIKMKITESLINVRGTIDRCRHQAKDLRDEIANIPASRLNKSVDEVVKVMGKVERLRVNHKPIAKEIRILGKCVSQGVLDDGQFGDGLTHCEPSHKE